MFRKSSKSLTGVVTDGSGTPSDSDGGVTGTGSSGKLKLVAGRHPALRDEESGTSLSAGPAGLAAPKISPPVSNPTAPPAASDCVVQLPPLCGASATAPVDSDAAVVCASTSEAASTDHDNESNLASSSWTLHLMSRILPKALLSNTGMVVALLMSSALLAGGVYGASQQKLEFDLDAFIAPSYSIHDAYAVRNKYFGVSCKNPTLQVASELVVKRVMTVTQAAMDAL
jgi:hypothetical protein